MRITNVSGTRNDLLQEITNDTTTIIADLHKQPALAGAIPKQFKHDGFLGPHAKTSRRTYTVPADKYARIVSCSLSLSATGSITLNGSQQGILEITPDGGAAIIIFDQGVTINAAGEIYNSYAFIDYIMSEGDQVEYFTSDAHTADLLYWSFSASIYEYDV